MAKLTLNNIIKKYDNDHKAVDRFNLDIEEKEFIVLVGPSGCGKSTTLRMIAGLEEISEGELIMDGKVMNKVEPKDRNIAMVFQNYALYPHMTVYDNMAYGLKVRKVPKKEIKQKIEHAADILNLTEYLQRKPGALSGGQRQRVALGRAIVRESDYFLMDEPLSNLDAKLRVQMRTEIIQLHKKLGTTTIYVTHDQTEAMTMASRIVIMRDGIIQQVGTPKEVYNFPANVFVGSFIGSPPMNFIKAIFKENHLVIGQHQLNLSKRVQNRLLEKGYQNKELLIGVRPEDITYYPMNKNSELQYIQTEVQLTELYGSEVILYVDVEGNRITAKVDPDVELDAGTMIKLGFNVEKLHYFDCETEERIGPVKG